MSTTQQTHTKVAWRHWDGTYYKHRGHWPSAVNKVRSPIEADDFSKFCHEDIEDLQQSMTCDTPTVQGLWVKIKIEITATPI